MNKLVSLPEAAALVHTGDTLSLGGMTLYRRPVAFVCALLALPQPPRDLTLLSFTSSYESDLLVGAGVVKRVRTCYFGFEGFGFAPMFTQAANLGDLEVVEETEASLAFGLRATLADVGFMAGRGWVGTDLPRLRPDVKTITDPYSGEELMAFPALRPTVAVLHALEADAQGNARLNRNLGIDMELAIAAERVILTAEAIVDKLDQVDIVGPLVTAVAPAPRGAWPTSCHPLYPVDGAEVLNYLEACSREAFDAYLQTRLQTGAPVS
ncbi:MAG: CoA transferase subunit A [Anaerolineales bacterium]|nr:CoA transferase subunit A [Anaerolineales bacterium]